MKKSKVKRDPEVFSVLQNQNREIAFIYPDKTRRVMIIYYLGLIKYLNEAFRYPSGFLHFPC